MLDRIEWFHEKLKANVIFKDFRIDEYNQMIATWKIENYHENKHSENGFFYNARYLPKEKAFETYNLKYEGKKIGGLLIPEKFNIEEIEREVRKKFEEEKKAEKQKLNEKFSKGQTLNIHKSYLGFYLGEDYSKTDMGIKLNKILGDKYIERKVSKELEKYIIEEDWGEYSVTTYYKINNKDLEKILLNTEEAVEEERKKKEEKEKDRIEEITKKAKETGEKQIIHSWVEDCNDPYEECNLDHITIWVLPNGETKKTRSHTW